MGTMALLLFSCGGDHHVGTKNNKIKESKHISEVYPLANGAALATGHNEQGDKILILLVGSQASVVNGVPKDTYGLDVYPLSDGSAYIVFPDSDFNSWVYHLEGNNLVKVREVKQLPPISESVSPAGFLWATVISEKTRIARKKQEEEAAESAAEDARSDVN
jgi:hypothetical protein